MAGLIHKWLARHHKPAPTFTDAEHRWIMDAAMERARESIAMATTHDHIIVARAKADRIHADAAMFIAAGTQPSSVIAPDDFTQRTVNSNDVQEIALFGEVSYTFADVFTLTAGGTAQITFRGACEVKLRIVFDNDAAEERPGIDVCERQTVTVGPGWTTVEDLASFGGGSGSGGGAVTKDG